MSHVDAAASSRIYRFCSFRYSFRSDSSLYFSLCYTHFSCRNSLFVSRARQPRQSVKLLQTRARVSPTIARVVKFATFAAAAAVHSPECSSGCVYKPRRNRTRGETLWEKRKFVPMTMARIGCCTQGLLFTGVNRYKSSEHRCYQARVQYIDTRLSLPNSL